MHGLVDCPDLLVPGHDLDELAIVGLEEDERPQDVQEVPRAQAPCRQQFLGLERLRLLVEFRGDRLKGTGAVSFHPP